MKKLLAIFALISLGVSIHTRAIAESHTPLTLDLTPEQKTYTEVFEVKGVDKKELFVRANSWFATIFSNSESVIQFSDKESGKIIGNYYQEMTNIDSLWGVKQVIEVDVKDEKVRIVIQNLTAAIIGDRMEGKFIFTKATNWGETNDLFIIIKTRENWKSLSTSLKNKLNSKDSW